MSETAVPAPVAEPPASVSPFRWRLAHRPDTRFGHAAGGVAGVLVTAAMVAFVAAIDEDDPQLAGVALSLVLLVAAVAAGFWQRGPVRSAAVTAIVLTFPLLWLFAVIGDGDSGGRGDVRIILLLTVVSYVVMYLATWTRGRAVLLGAALLVAANWLLFEVADEPTPFPFGAAETFGSRGVFGSASAVGADNSRSVAIIAVLIGLGLLGAGALLDRRKAHGIATPFLVVGALYAVIGALALGADIEDTYAIGIFVAVAGLAIGLAGTFGRRRATSWIGAIVLLGGAATVVGKATDDSASGSGGEALFGLFALLAAGALLAIGIATARAAREPVDGGEPAPEPAPVLVGAPTAETPTAETPAAKTPAAETPTAETPTEETPTDETGPSDSWSRPESES